MRAPVLNMRFLQTWSIRTKMTWAFVTLIALIAILGGVATLSLTVVNRASSDLAGIWLPGVKHLSEARVAMLEFREFEIKHTQAADSSYMSEYEEKMGKAMVAVNQGFQEFHALASAMPEQRPLVDALDKSWQAYLAQNKKIVAMSHDNKQQDAKDVSDGAGKDLFETALLGVDKLSTFGFDQGQQAAESANGTFQKARLLVLGVVLVSIPLGIALAVLITSSLLRQLGGEPRTAVSLVKAVAAGDLSTPIRLRPGDSTSLMAALQDMQTQLSEVVTAVRRASESVATASSEIAQGNNDLSTRTEHQASALEETAASMEQLGSTVNQNAENARHADDLAREATEVAIRGGAVVHEVVDTMKVINDSSRRIADITGVIDSIAFQTNILALNAAVEAARAGEQGRGFAVVAAEVRSLAQRSANAAKEIKSLITASVEQVQRGTTQVDKAGETMDQVVNAIRRVTEIVNDISLASSQQSDGVRQVGEAVTQMDKGTQQNAALVEQSAAAAESLKDQAGQLVASVAVFKTA